MHSIRRAACRLISARPTSALSKSQTQFVSLKTPVSYKFQPWTASVVRRAFASQAEDHDQTQSEPVADGAEGQAGDNSIANSSTAAPEVPDAPESADPEHKSTVASAISSAAQTATDAASSVASAATDAFTGNEGNKPLGDPTTTVYVGNLYFDVTVDMLRQEMAKYGKVEEAKVIMDIRGLSKGFGYVSFENPTSAAKAIETLHMQTFEGRRIVVQYAMSKTRPPPTGGKNPVTRTLFIGNMSFEMSDQDLNDLFRGIPNVIDVRVAIDRRTGQPRGFAHADFTDAKSAEAALTKLDGREFYGRKLRLDYNSPSSSRQGAMNNHATRR